MAQNNDNIRITANQKFEYRLPQKNGKTGRKRIKANDDY